MVDVCNVLLATLCLGVTTLKVETIKTKLFFAGSFITTAVVDAASGGGQQGAPRPRHPYSKTICGTHKAVNSRSKDDNKFSLKNI
jgi:hypothetical protein